MMLYLSLILVPILLGIWAQMRVKNAFSEYSQLRATSNITGAQAAQAILEAAQIDDVEVVEINDMLGDHYDPGKKRLCLSSDVYHTASVAALGVAAHETGHAIQHARGYAPLHARMAMVPLSVVASQGLQFAILAGWFLHTIGLVKIAIICMLVLTLFQLITLPVEFDASRRAKNVLQKMGMIQSNVEAEGVNRVLNAAALTYVAAFVSSLLMLLVYILRLQGNRD